MNVKGKVGDWAKGSHNEGANGDVRNEAAVHDINVNPVATRLIDSLNLIKEGWEWIQVVKDTNSQSYDGEECYLPSAHSNAEYLLSEGSKVCG